MPGAGNLKDRVRFQQRALNGDGDRLGDWDEATEFERRAEIVYLRGGEPVMQQRLTGAQPVVITVYDETAARAVDNSWRAVDVRTNAAYDIQTNAPNKDRRFRDLLAVEIKGAGAEGGG